MGGLIGAFMAILDIQITNASLKDIQGALSATLSESSWISTSYLVAEMIAKLQSADEATVDYVWRNPVTNVVENKRSYVRRDGRSLIGVGHYLE